MKLARAHMRNVRVVFKVSAESVELIVAEKTPSNHAHMLYRKTASVAKRDVKLGKKLDAMYGSAVDRLLREFEGACQKDAALTMHVVRAHFFYEPPLAHYSLVPIKLHAEKPSVLNERVLASAVAAAETSFSENKGGAAKLSIIERTLTSTILDGYPVNEFISRTYKDFSATLLLAGVPTGITARLSVSMNSVFPKAREAHANLELSVLAALGLGAKDQNHLVCIILPETTAVSYIRGGIPVCRGDIPFGSEKIILSLAHELGVTRTIVRSYVQMRLDKKLDATSEAQVASALAVVAQSWQKELSSLRRDFNERYLLPKLIYTVPSARADAEILASIPLKGSDEYGAYEYRAVSDSQLIQIDAADSLGITPLNSVLLKTLLIDA